MRGARRCECAEPDWRVKGKPLRESEVYSKRAQARKMQDWHYRWAVEALRVLKPGGFLLAFGGTRTAHRLACAVEDAGFEIRDRVLALGSDGKGGDAVYELGAELDWLYGSGFPKSLDVSKAIDKAARGVPQGGVDPTSPHHGQYRTTTTEGKRWEGDSGQSYGAGGSRFLTDGTASGSAMGPVESGVADVVSEAEQWQGWGTALAPSHEPVVVARKPLVGTVAENVQRFGTGAINVDATRVSGTKPVMRRTDTVVAANAMAGESTGATSTGETTSEGRWPKNTVLVHDSRCRQTGTKKVRGSGQASGPTVNQLGDSMIYGEADGDRAAPPYYADPDGTETVVAWECHPECMVGRLDEQAGERTSGDLKPYANAPSEFNQLHSQQRTVDRPGDSGSASRFFPQFQAERARYVAKAARRERNAGLEGFEDGDKRNQSAWGRTCNVGGCSFVDPNTGKPKCAHDDFAWTQTGSAKNVHPTVKPVALLRWLTRLVTRPGGTVLDCFAGSGSTGIACVLEGFDFIGIEKQGPEYVKANSGGYQRQRQANATKWCRKCGKQAVNMPGSACSCAEPDWETKERQGGDVHTPDDYVSMARARIAHAETHPWDYDPDIPAPKKPDPIPGQMELLP